MRISLSERSIRSPNMPVLTNLVKWAFESIADRGLTLLGKGFDATASIETLCAELISERGEASGTALARAIIQRYRALAPAARTRFFRGLLDQRWLADPKEVLELAQGYHQHPGAAELSRLFAAVEPRRQELLRRINMGPSGTETLVDMRSHLLTLLPNQPDLEPVNDDFAHLLSSWFNRGFLELRKIDWRTPAVVLEKLIQYEAVHEIRGWKDLRRRLDRDRRCFAFFHPALPDQPLIFVEIALTQGTPSNIQPLIDDKTESADPANADTAVFYSINNCLDGLRGISFGAFLLKQVIHELTSEGLPIKTFVTLSPIPRFQAWLLKQKPKLPGGVKAESLTAEILDRKTPESKALGIELTRLCAQYLTSTKEGRALDPVASFHLRNGASIERILWMADTSDKGMSQSLGMMVNYLYRPARIERNHEQYVKEGKVACSDGVQTLLQTPLLEARK